MRRVSTLFGSVDLLRPSGRPDAVKGTNSLYSRVISVGGKTSWRGNHQSLLVGPVELEPGVTGQKPVGVGVSSLRPPAWQVGAALHRERL
ncbi:unnamed protein product, partial [Protopolystoma xenopodis]